MRVQVIDPQNTIQCGICHAQGDWVKKLDVGGIYGLYCLKWDTLTVYEPIKTKYVYNAFKKECLKQKNLFQQFQDTVDNKK